MSLSPRAIATQGLGFGVRLTAVQGFGADQAQAGGLRRVSKRMLDAQRARLIDEDDVLLILALSCAGGAAVR